MAAVDIVVDANAEYCRITGPFSACCDVLCFATAAKAIGAVDGIIVVNDDDVVDNANVICCCAWDDAAIDEFNAAEIDVVTFVLDADENIACIADTFS